MTFKQLSALKPGDKFGLEPPAHPWTVTTVDQWNVTAKHPTMGDKVLPKSAPQWRKYQVIQ